MKKTDKIFVAGHAGLVGSALVRNLEKKGYTNLIKRTSKELDLTRQTLVEEFFQAEKPDYVFLAAAKVGGIHANNSMPAEFIYINNMIETNVIHAAYQNGVKKLLFMSSGCSYPRDCPQPIDESYLLTGTLEKTNEPYAVSKIAGVTMCHAYNTQYGTDYVSVMPCNLYGEGDNYHPENSHVVPALLRKFHEAKEAKAPSVTLWGTGTAMREFMHIEDTAAGCVFLMEQEKLPHDLYNIGFGSDITILELAHLIEKVVGFQGELVFDPTMPDGTPRKLLNSKRLFDLGWKPEISLEEGLARTYEDYLENKDKYRS